MIQIENEQKQFDNFLKLIQKEASAKCETKIELKETGYNIAYKQKGLSSFSNINFFNKLLYFY